MCLGESWLSPLGLARNCGRSIYQECDADLASESGEIDGKL